MKISLEFRFNINIATIPTFVYKYRRCLQSFQVFMLQLIRKFQLNPGLSRLLPVVPHFSIENIRNVRLLDLGRQRLNIYNYV